MAILKNRFNSRNFDLKHIIALGVYAAVTLFALLHHEIWRDEAQSWLISQNQSFGEITYFMRYEGHIALWSWFLKVLQFFSSSILFAQIVVWLISCLAVIMFFQLKSIPFYFKLAIAFNILMLFTYSVIFRCYSLMPIFLASGMFFYERKKIILYAVFVALFSNIHIMTMGFSALIMCWLYYESMKEKDYKKAIGASVILVALIVAILQLAPSMTSNTSVAPSVFSQTYTIKSVIKLAIDQIGAIYYNYFYFGTFPSIIKFGIVTAILVLMCTSLILLSEKHFKIFFWFLIYYILILIFIYRIGAGDPFMTYMPRANIIFIVYLFCLISAMIESGAGRKKAVAAIIASVILFASLPNAIQKTSLDYKEQLSTGKELAEVISEEVTDDDLIITNFDFTVSSILAYLPEKKVWYPVQDEMISYTIWDDSKKQNHYDNFKEMMQHVPYLGTYENIYFLETSIDELFSVDDTVNADMIYQSTTSYIPTENFTLYKISDD